MKKLLNGVLVDMSEEEVNELNRATQSLKLAEMTEAPTLDTSSKMEAFLNSISAPTITETEELPVKLGYKWKLVYQSDNNSFVWESVEDPDAIGTSTNPIVYYVGCPLFLNGFYVSDGITYICINDEGTPTDVTDLNFFEPL